MIIHGETPNAQACLFFRGLTLSGSDVADQFVQRFSFLGFRCICRVAQRGKDERFGAFREIEDFARSIGIECAYPTWAQSEIRGGKDEMVHNDGNINPKVIPAVLAFPRLTRQSTCADDQGSLDKPLFVVYAL